MVRLTAEDRMLRQVGEKEFQDQVTDLAVLLGWEWVHFRPAMTTKGWRTPVSGTIGKDWPDLVLVRVRDKRLIFAELKRETTHPTAGQERVLDILRSLVHDRYRHSPALAFGVLAFPQVEVHVWRPSDIERIAEILR